MYFQNTEQIKRQEDIIEFARLLSKSCDEFANNCTEPSDCHVCRATMIYDAGWRKVK